MREATSRRERRLIVSLLWAMFVSPVAIAAYGAFGGQNNAVLAGLFAGSLCAFAALVTLSLRVNVRAGGAIYAFGKWVTRATHPTRYWVSVALMVLVGVVAPLCLVSFILFVRQ